MKKILLLISLVSLSFLVKAQTGITITSGNNLFIMDYGTYIPADGFRYSKVTYPKASILSLFEIDDSSYIKLTYADTYTQYLTFDQTNTIPDYEIVKSVNGVTPTNQAHLYTLLKNVLLEYYNYSNLTGTATIKTGPGILQNIIINKANSLGTITIYDNTSGSGVKIGTISFPLTLLSSQTVLNYNVSFKTGLTIVITGTMDITTTWL